MEPGYVQRDGLVVASFPKNRNHSSIPTKWTIPANTVLTVVLDSKCEINHTVSGFKGDSVKDFVYRLKGKHLIESVYITIPSKANTNG